MEFETLIFQVEDPADATIIGVDGDTVARTAAAPEPNGVLQPDFNGDGYVDLNGGAEPKISIDFNAPAGTYYVTIRVAASSDRSLAVSVDGGALTEARNGFTGSFAAWKNIVFPVTVASDGDHTLVIEQTTGAGPNIDQVTISQAPATQDFAVTLQAEDFGQIDDSGAPNMLHRVFDDPSTAETGDDKDRFGLWDGYGGRGYTDFGEETADKLSLVVTVPEAGVYEVHVRYANGSGFAPNRYLDIVNETTGDQIQTVNFNRVGQAGWTDWNVKTFAMALAAGDNTIAFVINPDTDLNPTITGPNIDAVAVTSPGVAADFTVPNTAPAIFDVSFTVPENSTEVGIVDADDVDASDTLSYSITGGADAALFSIHGVTGALNFISAPDFESPGDLNGDNIYELQVSVSDGVATTSRDLTIAVANLAETAEPFTPIVLEPSDDSITLSSNPDGDATVTIHRDNDDPNDAEESNLGDALDEFGLRKGYSGTGYLDFGDDPGDMATFTFEVPEAGLYDVNIRYASQDTGNPAAPRVLDVSYNGGTAVTTTFASTGPNTGPQTQQGFSIWGFLTQTVQLQAGTNTLSLAMAPGTSAGPNIDRVEITEAGSGPIDSSADEDGNYAAAPALPAVEEGDLSAVQFRLTGVDADIQLFEVSLDGGTSFTPVTAAQVGPAYLITLDLSGFAGQSSASALFRVTDEVGNTASSSASVTILEEGLEPFTREIQLEDLSLVTIDDAGGLAVTEVATEHAGFTGFGFMDMGQDIGDAISFVIDAPAAGSYSFTFRYANGSDTNRDMALTRTFDSVVTDLDDVAFSPTGAWTTWSEVTVDLQLEAGENTIELANTIANGPNLDRVIVSNNVPRDIEPGPRETIQINFQDGPTAVVGGYLVDNFDGFGDRGNGYSYGWVTEASATDADGTTNTPINGAAFPDIAINERTGAPFDGYDPRLTGYAHFDLRDTYPNSARTAWEIALADGWYEVTVSVGDTGGANDSNNRLFIEGDLVTAWTPTDIYKSQLVTTVAHVEDGHLTLSAQGGEVTEIQYIDIRALPDLTPGDGNEAPADYAFFFDARAVAGVGANVVTTDLDLGDGARPENVDPTSDFFLGLSVVDGRGGALLESLEDGSVRLYETLTGATVPINVNTTGGFDSLTISPIGTLKEFTSYTLVIDGFQDRGPNDDPNAPTREFQKFSTTFTTGEAPEVTAREVAFVDTLELNGAADGAFAFTSVELAPDGSKLYASTLNGQIKSWDLDPTTGAILKDTETTFTPGGDFNVNVGDHVERRGIIGLAFDPEDSNTIWITDNYPVPLDGRSDSVPDFSGRVSKVTLGSNGLADATVETYLHGLPRSNGDHVTNSIEFRANPDAGQAGEPDYLMYIVQGSNSAMGQADSAWGGRPERLLNAAVLEIDYTRAAPSGGFDVATEPLPADGLNRRFADNDGDLKNGGIPITSGEHAGLFLHFDENGVASVRQGADASSNQVEEYYNPYAEDAVLRIFAHGQRNAYDLVWHSNGFLYIPANGSAAGGNVPDDPNTPQNEGVNNVGLQNDYLFRVVEDGYYGHPNPLRDKYVMNGGNPTGGTDKNQVSNYPVGTLPDPEYDIDGAYSLGTNRSPNGAIEYTSDVFGTSLEGAILFTEYSGGNDVRAIIVGPDGAPVEDFVLQRPDGTTINIYPDPLDVTQDANGRIYLMTLNRSNGQSQIIRLDPAPGGVVDDLSANEGGDLALAVVDASNASAVVFEVSGLDADIVFISAAFGGGAPIPVSLNNQGRFTVDLSAFSGQIAASLTVTDDDGNVATVGTSVAPGQNFITLLTIEAEDTTPIAIDGAEVDSGGDVEIRDVNNPEPEFGIRGGAYGVDGDTDYNDGVPGGYADFGSNNSDFLTFRFEVDAAHAGAAQLRFRFANGGDNGANRPLSVTVNGVTLGVQDFPATPGDWEQWGVVTVPATLIAGTNTVTLRSVNNTGPNIDRLEVLTYGDPVPPFAPDFVPVDGEARIELEQTADNSTRILSANAVEFFFTVDENGAYAFDLAADAGAPDGEQLTLYLNGVELQSTDFPGVGTAGEASAYAALEAGEQYTLRVVSDAMGASDLDYLDVRLTPSDPNADIEIQSLDPVFFNDRLQFSFLLDDSASQANRADKETAVVRISNSGTSPLQFLDADISQYFSLQNPTVFDGLTLAPGQSIDVTVVFEGGDVPPRSNGVSGVVDGALTLRTNDAENPVVTVDLAGFWQSRDEGGQEPSVNEVWEIFGFGNEIQGLSFQGAGENGVLDFYDLYLPYDLDDPLEVLSPFWRIAEGETTATITQIAAFNGSNGGNFAGIHAPGNSNTEIHFWRTQGNHNQRLLPLNFGEAGFSTGSFTNATIPNGWNGPDTFSIEIEDFGANYSTDPTQNVGAGNLPSQGELNSRYPGYTVSNGQVFDPEGAPVQDGYLMRIFQAVDQDGIPIPNTYLGIQDTAGINYDYNDTMVVITGVTPVGSNFNGQNRNPIAAADDLLVEANQANIVDVLSNDSDPDSGDSIQVIAVSDGAHGTVTLNANGTVTYTPTPGFQGVDSFTYGVMDSFGATARATVVVTVGEIPNTPPNALNDTATTDAGVEAVIDVLDNDSDADNDALTIQSVTQGANGSVVINANGTVTYTPNANFSGQDSFTYTVFDGEDTDTATVTVTVTPPPNEAPVGVDDAFSVDEDGVLTDNVLANDTDNENDALTASLVSGPSNGQLTLNPDGSFTYTPDANFSGTDSFVYEVSDATGVDQATATITVNAVDDAPAAVDDEVSVAASPAAGAPNETVLDVLGNDLDSGEGDVTIIAVGTSSLGGTVQIASDGLSLIYTAPTATGVDTFTYTIQDGSNPPSVATVTVTVTDAPNLAPTGVDDVFSVDEDGVLTDNVLANDTDPENDALTASLVSGPSNGQLTLNPDGSFTYTPDANFNGSDSFTYAVSDGEDSDEATVQITVNPVNDAPEPTDDTAIAASAPVTIDVLANDDDADGDALSVAAVSQGTNGSVVINQNGTVTYTPDANFTGQDSFTYDVTDGTETVTALVTVTVTDAPNQAPTGVDDAFSVDEDGVLTDNVLANDTDPENGALTASLVSGPANGQLTLNPDGSFTYTPDANFNGSDSFTYAVSDGEDSDEATVQITVNPTNDPVVAVGDGAATGAGQPVVIDVLDNDQDIDGDALTVAAVSQGANGSVTINANGTVTYTPNAGFSGSDSFTYDVTDGETVDTATVTVAVAAAPSGPTPIYLREDGVDGFDGTFNGQTGTQQIQPVNPLGGVTNGGVEVVVTFNDLIGSQGIVSADAGYFGTGGHFNLRANGAALDLRLQNGSGNSGQDFRIIVPNVLTAGQPIHIFASFGPDGLQLYVNGNEVASNPYTGGTFGNTEALVLGANNWVSTAGTTNNITDPLNGEIARFAIYGEQPDDGEVQALSDAFFNPVSTVVVNDTATVVEDGSVAIDVLANEAGANAGPLTLVSATDGANGSTQIVNGQVVYTPDADFFGTDSFTYVAATPDGGSATATVTVTVTPENDPVVAVNDVASTAAEPVVIDVLANDEDVDGDALTVSAVSQGANGSVVINANGTVTYTPNSGFTGSDSFTYDVTDGATTDTATVVVTVSSAPNQAPTGVDDAFSVDEDGVLTDNVLANDTDPENGALTASLVSGPANGQLTLNPDGSFTYTPDADFAGTDSFVYAVSDGEDSDEATVTLTVTPVNDAPEPIDDTAIAASAPVTIDVLANDDDPDGDALTVAAVSQGANGSVVINQNGTVTYTPDANFTGSDSFTYDVTDGTETATATVVVTVTDAPNQPPVGVDDAFSVDEDGVLTDSVLANDTDNENDALSVTEVSGPAHGQLALNSDGTFTYTPDPDFNGSDSFVYAVSDGTGSDQATVQITVDPTNDPVAAVNDNAASAAGAPIVINVLGNDQDIDGDALSVASVTQGANGSVVINSNGTVTYTPNSGFSGSDSFTYDVTDGVTTDTATVTVSVSAAPSGPTPIYLREDGVDGFDGTFSGQNGTQQIQPTNPLGGVSNGGVEVVITFNDLIGSQGIVSSDAGYYGTGGHFNLRANGNGLDLRLQDGSGTSGNDYRIIVPNVLTAGQETHIFASFGPDGLGLYVDGVLVGSSPYTGSTFGNTEALVLGANNWVSTAGTTNNITDPLNGEIERFAIYGDQPTPQEIAQLAEGGPSTPSNQPPVAVGDAITVAEDGSETFAPAANDFDPDGGTVTVASVTNGANGSAQLNANGTVTYTPNPNFFGSDSFTVTVQDGQGGTAQSTVTVTVTGVNDAPNAVNDSASTSDGEAVAISVLGNDADPDGDALTVSAVTQGANGSVVINSNGTVTYTPTGGFTGSDSFTYTVSDGQETDTATVSVTVTEAPSAPPVGVDDSYVLAEDGSVSDNVLANDTDPENDPLTASLVSGPSHGELSLSGDGSFTYTPDADFFGQDSFIYAVSDGGGSDQATVTLTVTGVDDDPVALDDSAATSAGAPVTVSVLANDVDADGDALSVIGISNEVGGSAAINPNGTVTFTPDSGFEGDGGFDYILSDGSGPTDVGSVSVAVAGVPTGPTPVFSQGTLVFGGSTQDVVSITPAAAPNIAEGTIAFSFTAQNVVTRQGLVSRDAFGDGDHLLIYIQNGQLIGRFQDGDETSTFRTNISANQEVEVAATFGSGGVEFFVNGASIGADATNSLNWSNNPEYLEIGAMSWTVQSGSGSFSDPFGPGQIAELEIYDLVLTDQQIDDLAHDLFS